MQMIQNFHLNKEAMYRREHLLFVFVIFVFIGDIKSHVPEFPEADRLISHLILHELVLAFPRKIFSIPQPVCQIAENFDDSPALKHGLYCPLEQRYAGFIHPVGNDPALLQVSAVRENDVAQFGGVRHEALDGTGKIEFFYGTFYGRFTSLRQYRIAKIADHGFQVAFVYILFEIARDPAAPEMSLVQLEFLGIVWWFRLVIGPG